MNISHYGLEIMKYFATIHEFVSRLSCAM